MLSDRQYVVSSSKLSPEAERSQRELFWYREELFKVVHGRWREVRVMIHNSVSLLTTTGSRTEVQEPVTSHCGSNV